MFRAGDTTWQALFLKDGLIGGKVRALKGGAVVFEHAPNPAADRCQEPAEVLPLSSFIMTNDDTGIIGATSLYFPSSSASAPAS
ncbi:MAG: hypothetical protein A2W03_06285 [Candidatus Aminicenantes bacterium RBG_16_63_16]|nr:MAG: hypothetical protein A2W03_06285 [Candidatus Aminicenantes bacterium RBG_16_63_16]